MSWKSLVTAGLLCVVAVPAWAAPSIKVLDGGLSGGNRVWNVVVTPTGTSSVGVELGFARPTGLGNILTAVSNANWADDGIAPVGNPGSNPYTGTQTEGVVLGAGGANVFASLGSTNILTGGVDSTVLTITTQGPISVLDLSGVFGPGSDSAFLAETVGGVSSIATPKLRYGIYGDFAAGSPNNAVNSADFGEFASLFGKPVASQTVLEKQIIDRFLLPGGGVVGAAQFGQFASNFGFSGPAAASGSGGLAVPEPTSFGMLLLAVCGLMARRSR